MKRRRFLMAAGSTPLITTGVSATSEPVDPGFIGEHFFDALRNVEDQRRGEVLVECANALCLQERISEQITAEIAGNTDSINTHIRRARFGVRILNENNITHAIDESMVQEVENRSRHYTRFIPLIGSFNNLQHAACQIGDEPTEEEVRKFLYASIAFGLEVGLWHSAMPYRMAWDGTRFVSNRTFLRYINHSCNGCIALAMSELHWALRSIPYTVVDDSKVEFVWRSSRSCENTVRK